MKGFKRTNRLSVSWRAQSFQALSTDAWSDRSGGDHDLISLMRPVLRIIYTLLICDGLSRIRKEGLTVTRISWYILDDVLCSGRGWRRPMD